jgi:predicted pyridoxine 5'-phosphate oxidase superfamily flavin-nucleotide-binding protein
MPTGFSALTTTAAVRKEQLHYYGASRPIPSEAGSDTLTEEEKNFIEERDSFYLSTVTETGWPYIQHRGGSPGFLRVTGPQSLAFADYKGNRQLVTTGNIAAGSRVALFLMDYPRQTRLKILGHARVEDARSNADLVKQLAEPERWSKVERLFFIDVVAFDWNCPQYITPRYTLAEIEQMVRPLRERIADLTQQIEKKGKS